MYYILYYMLCVLYICVLYTILYAMCIIYMCIIYYITILYECGHCLIRGNRALAIER